MTTVVTIGAWICGCCKKQIYRKDLHLKTLGCKDATFQWITIDVKVDDAAFPAAEKLAANERRRQKPGPKPFDARLILKNTIPLFSEGSEMCRRGLDRRIEYLTKRVKLLEYLLHDCAAFFHRRVFFWFQSLYGPDAPPEFRSIIFRGGNKAYYTRDMYEVFDNENSVEPDSLEEVVASVECSRVFKMQLLQEVLDVITCVCETSIAAQGLTKLEHDAMAFMDWMHQSEGGLTLYESIADPKSFTAVRQHRQSLAKERKKLLDTFFIAFEANLHPKKNEATQKVLLAQN